MLLVGLRLWTKALHPNTRNSNSEKIRELGSDRRRQDKGVSKLSTLDGYLLIKKQAVRMASPQKRFGTLAVKSKDLATSKR